MDTTVTTAPTPFNRIAAGWKRHERKVLIALTVVSTGAAVTMRTGIAQHNAFLKERGLYEEFYALTEEA